MLGECQSASSEPYMRLNRHDEAMISILKAITCPSNMMGPSSQVPAEVACTHVKQQQQSDIVAVHNPKASALQR